MIRRRQRGCDHSEAPSSYSVSTGRFTFCSCHCVRVPLMSVHIFIQVSYIPVLTIPVHGLSHMKTGGRKIRVIFPSFIFLFIVMQISSAPGSQPGIPSFAPPIQYSHPPCVNQSGDENADEYEYTDVTAPS